MNKSGGALGVQELNSATPPTQSQPRRLLDGQYVLHRPGCSQENDQLLREGWKRPDSRRGRDSRNTIRLEPLDEDSAEAVDGSDGSYPIHGMDLQPCASPRGRNRNRRRMILCQI